MSYNRTECHIWAAVERQVELVQVRHPVHEKIAVALLAVHGDDAVARHDLLAWVGVIVVLDSSSAHALNQDEVVGIEGEALRTQHFTVLLYVRCPDLGPHHVQLHVGLGSDPFAHLRRLPRLPVHGDDEVAAHQREGRQHGIVVALRGIVPWPDPINVQELAIAQVHVEAQAHLALDLLHLRAELLLLVVVRHRIYVASVIIFG
mmetsp:Transcript_87645/g.225809  ORF Transcript_87645/g.225809 Transcript_87645/m.225809 type:complete len:204 (+) Transcript_87645:322-933(+)